MNKEEERRARTKSNLVYLACRSAAQKGALYVAHGYKLRTLTTLKLEVPEQQIGAACRFLDHRSVQRVFQCLWKTETNRRKRALVVQCIQQKLRDALEWQSKLCSNHRDQ